MGIKSKLENAYFELTAPNKNELKKEVNLLDNNVVDNSILQKSVNKLKEKIQLSQTGKQREVLEEQLEELKKINLSYKKYISRNLTARIKKEITNLFNGLENQINLKENQISDDLEQINRLLNTEQERLKDTLDIFSYGTIRDQIEDYLDIENIYESISPETFQKLFNIATIEYINILENRINRRLNKDDINFILEQKGLLLTTEEIQIFSKNIQSKIQLNKDITYKLKLFNTKIVKLKLNKRQNSALKSINIPDLFENIQTDDTKITKKFEKLNTQEKMKIIKNILENSKNNKFLLAVIDKLKNKTVEFESKKIKLTENFINTHKNLILNNLKNMILMTIHIESDGDYKAKNIEGSSGKGIGQWLDGNGKHSIEYMYNKKWYTKEQLKKLDISNLKQRTVRNTSSFETKLKGIYNGYNNELLDNLSFSIPKKYNKKIVLSPLDLNLEQQIQLLILGIGISSKKIEDKLLKKVGIDYFMGLALLGNKEAIIKIYKKFHHTNPDKITLKRIEKISPIYTKKILQI